MSIRKDVTVKITNNNATLDMPLQIYELDHGIELRFKLMDYKYKYTKDPQNILNSSDEDILEAYTTIINPRGYELQQINGEVKDDIVIFMIDSSYTDEIDEIGTYSLQIHIKCACSEFSIPPIQFEVLQRLKGVKVVTDGEDSIDDSALIDNYSNFISDETGKLLIEWKKGDIISSVKLNAMVEVINNAVDEEVQRQANEVKREQQELERQNKVREALNSVDNRVDEAMIEYETRFNALTVSQQQDMEVIDARDGEVSLKARLDRDLRNPLQVYEDVEGSYISCDSVEGYAQNVEILGNTIQNQNDLADIRSVGDKVEGQELYEIPVLSCGKNLFNGVIYKENGFYYVSGEWSVSNKLDTFRIKCKPNTQYIKNSYVNGIVTFFDSDNSFISGVNAPKMPFTTPDNCYWFCISVNKANVDNAQLEEGTVTTPYEPYVEDKLTILSPTPLEKVEDVADRIICKDGIWGVEKNIGTIVLDGAMIQMSDVYNGFNLHVLTLNDMSTTLSGAKINLISGVGNVISYNNRFVDMKEGNIYATPSSKKIYFITTKEVSIFNAELKDKNIKYILGTPTFIQLPYDQQIKLRTFANKTNISFGCEIEPTLKASVPKSLSSTVSTHTEQIDNLGKELEKIKKLEESTISTVTTESGFTTVEQTSNGYFEDVKIEGKTLVNLYPKLDTKNYMNIGTGVTFSDDTITINANGDWQNFTIKKDAMPLKTSTYYTFVIDIIDNTLEGDNPIINFGNTFRDDPAKFSSEHTLDVRGKKGIYTFKLMTRDSFDDSNINLDTRDYLTNTATSGTIVFKYMILEGDHTQNPPSYFEGLKSVGQDVDEISVESVKGDGNLCEGNELNISIKNGVSGTFSKYIAFRPTSDSVAYFVDCEGGQLNTANVAFSFLDKSKNILGTPDYTPTNLPNYNFKFSDRGIKYSDVYYIKLFWNDKVGKDVMISNLTFISGNIAPTKHITHQPNKKRILYYNDETQKWEKPVLREWDSIEKHSDGKYYYHKRSGEVVLNGSENWRIRPDVTDDGVHVIFSVFTPFKYNKSSYMICDKFNPKSVAVANEAYSKGEGIAYYNYSGGSEYAIYYVISKSKLTSQDTQGFAQWLQANPTRLVYQLETEEVYECTSIDLITYGNETNFIVNTGAIEPLTTLKVMCNINNVVRELQQKVSNLENYIQHVMIDALNNALNE